mmetsp:Transcript_9361/g.28156  ORF Transcript_9361/g.28156 Transcript_9361/m.28156 type:complete len:146 (-) Transcript_9361:161-598(-)
MAFLRRSLKCLAQIILLSSVNALVPAQTRPRTAATVRHATVSETIAPLKDAVAELAARTRDARLLAEELLPYDTDEQLDAWLVRFLGGGDADAIDEAEAKVVASVEWRAGPGRAIATAARDARRRPQSFEVACVLGAAWGASVQK